MLPELRKNFLDLFHLPCMWMHMCVCGEGGQRSTFNLQTDSLAGRKGV